MERSRLGFLLVLLGVIVLLTSLFVVLPLSSALYVISLFGMFTGVVMIAMGIAISKEMENSLGVDREECYYCNGSGKVNQETCPRCGGTGIAPPED
jgi:hypothetical protein